MSGPVAVVGADGMLGRAWTELLARKGVEALGLAPPLIDIRDGESVERAIPSGVRAVVNCAAYTDVDGAETDEVAANAVNGLGVKHLVARCDALGIPLIHYSTDYVFDGCERSEPYRVDDPPDPINAYGRSKRIGEEHVLASAGHLLIRTSWLYAPWGKNFVRTIARLAAERERLTVVDDQRGRPTSAEHLAAASWELLGRGAAGVFHVTDGGECTWFEFATQIASAVAPSCVVQRVGSDAHPRSAPRPAYSTLDISGTEALLGPMPPWESNLDAVLSRLE